MNALKIFFFLLLTQSLTAQQQPAWIRDSLDTWVLRVMQAEQLPGLALAVVQDGKVVLQRTYGVRTTGQSDKVDDQTLFMIGSNSKAYTGTALAMLENEGALSLDDKVTRWLPDFRLYDDCATRMVTIRDILSHRIGMRTFQGDFTFWASNLSREATIKKMALLVPTYEFRTRFGYCNSGFLTAGQIIPAATKGQTWEDFVRKRFFEPLDMRHSLALSAELVAAKNAARPHAFYDHRLQLFDYQNIDNLAPAGSISMSISDMTHWVQMQLDTGRYMGKQVIPQKVILKTWDANTIVSPRSGYSYGLGWFIAYPDGKKMLDHTGGVDGFLSATAFIPELHLGVMVLTNSDNNTLYGSVRDQLLQAYRGITGPNHIASAHEGWVENEKEEQTRIGNMRAKIATATPLTTAALQAYTGIYTNALYGDIEVRLEKGQLRVYLSNHPNSTATLEYMNDNTFMATYRSPTHGIHPLVFKVTDGKISGCTLKINDFVEYGSYDFVRK